MRREIKIPNPEAEEKATELDLSPELYEIDLCFDTKETVALFRKRNCKIRITSGTGDQSLGTVILDTGASPNLFYKSALP